MTSEQKAVLGNAIIAILESTDMTMEESVDFLDRLTDSGKEALKAIRERRNSNDEL